MHIHRPVLIQQSVSSRMDLQQAPIRGRPYTVLRPVAKGAYGSVVLIHTSATQRLVALKIVPIAHPSILTDMEHVWLRMMCPGVVPHTIHSLGSISVQRLPADLVPYVDIGEATPAKYLLMLMPYVHGQSLREHLIRNPTTPLSRDQILHFIGQLAMFSYSAYHHYGMIHADLKLGNLVVTTSGRNLDIQVVDYTFAVQPDLETLEVSRLTWQRGTVVYLPPEKLFFETPPSYCMHPGGRACSDLWCIGALLSTMALSGRVAPLSNKLPQQEREDVATSDGMYSPARTDMLYYLLSDLRPWFGSLSIRMSQTSGIEIEYVQQAIRLVLWTRALYYPNKTDPRRMTHVLPTNEFLPGIEQTDLYRLLARHIGDIVRMYDEDGYETFERARALLVDVLGDNLFKVYVSTQSWVPADRGAALTYKNPFHWLAIATGNVPPPEHRSNPPVIRRVNPMMYPLHQSISLDGLVHALETHPCETCGGPATIYCNTCGRGRSCDAACYAQCHPGKH